jgi:hypothetical protein
MRSKLGKSANRLPRARFEELRVDLPRLDLDRVAIEVSLQP